MSRTFIKTVLIAAVTVTGISIATASPAKAGNDDLAKFLFGATALIIIGKAISDSDAKASTISTPRAKPQNKPRPKFSKALPSECLRRYNSRDGRVRMMSAYCLRDNYRFSNRLPESCKTRVRTYDGPRRGYQMRCLRDKGFYVTSR